MRGLRGVTSAVVAGGVGAAVLGLLPAAPAGAAPDPAPGRTSAAAAAIVPASAPTLTPDRRAVTHRADGARVTTTVTTDARDSEGPLDLRSVTSRVVVRRDRPPVRVTYDLTFFRRVAASTLHRRWRSVTLELQTDATRGANRNITISARRGRLHAELISNATRKPIAVLPVRSLDEHTLRVSGVRDLVGARRYFVHTRFHHRRSPACGWIDDDTQLVCQDVVPDRGWLALDRPAWPLLPRQAG